jgi:hypothetical protein
VTKSFISLEGDLLPWARNSHQVNGTPGTSLFATKRHGELILNEAKLKLKLNIILSAPVPTGVAGCYRQSSSHRAADIDGYSSEQSEYQLVCGEPKSSETGDPLRPNQAEVLESTVQLCLVRGVRGFK